jgi:hypothetical protein
LLARIRRVVCTLYRHGLREHLAAPTGDKLARICKRPVEMSHHRPSVTSSASGARTAVIGAAHGTPQPDRAIDAPWRETRCGVEEGIALGCAGLALFQA